MELYNLQLAVAKPNKEEIVNITAAITARIQKDKNNEGSSRRKYLLEIVDPKTQHLDILVSLIEDCRDGRILTNVSAILRECVSARSEFRPKALGRLVGLGLTSHLVTATNRLYKMDQIIDSVVVNCFWILSALAMKDKKFSLRVRLSGGVKFAHNIMKQFVGRPALLNPVLQVVKALARSTVTATLLGKDGALTTLKSLVIKISDKYTPKLRVTLECINFLTKIKANQLQAIRLNIISLFTAIFSARKKFMDRGKLTLKICGAILSIFLNTTSTRLGLHQLEEHNGLKILHEFCTSLPVNDELNKKWDRLLDRACAIVSRAAKKQELPVISLHSPFRFSIQRASLSVTDMTTGIQSSSTSTSRESTPGSDDSDSEFAEVGKAEENEESERVKEVGNLGPSLIPTRRDINDLIKSYGCLFPEFVSSNQTKPNINKIDLNVLDNDIRMNDAIVTSDNCDIKYRNHYARKANTGRAVIPFVKIAYPDWVSAESCVDVEPLIDRNVKVCRTKILKNIEKMMYVPNHNATKVVYDLDSLVDMSDEVTKLGNTDEYLVGVVDSEKGLNFESRFECGNLRKVIQLSDHEYDLILSPDINTSKHHQWFYFQVTNMQANFPYTFNIINYEKTNSQFNFGMMPVMYSVEENLRGFGHWTRVGEDICYYKNHFATGEGGMAEERSYMTASFTVKFKHSQDVCYLAYHFPYTYTKMMVHIDQMMENRREDVLLRTDELCKSEAGHNVPLLTITSSDPESPWPMEDRQFIVLSARVHPGETNASWVMQGSLEFLTGDSTHASDLRSRYIFKVVPMLNPDGVIHGSHRCGLSGEDLNRRWKSPNEKLHPSIFHAKGLIEYLTRVAKKRPVLFCDYHGHSRKKNVFLYGCSRAQSWWPPDRNTPDHPHTYQQLDSILSTINPVFSQKDCSYVVEKERESTARVVVWREFEVERSYTMESTFCGCNNKGEYHGTHINTHHLIQMGADFCRATIQLEEDEEESVEEDCVSVEVGWKGGASGWEGISGLVGSWRSPAFDSDASSCTSDTSDHSDANLETIQ